MRRTSVCLIVGLLAVGLEQTAFTDARAATPVSVRPAHYAQTDLIGQHHNSVSQGSAVAVAGSTVAVSTSQGGKGAVDVYDGAADSPATSRPTAVLSPPPTANADEFGTAIAMTSDLIIVTAPDDFPADTKAAAAYVYVRSQTGWQSTSSPYATLSEATPAAEDGFGDSVATDGTSIAVGVPYASLNGAGAVDVFSTAGNGWTGTFDSPAVLTDSSTYDQFGTSVAISSGLVAAGAPGSTVGSAGDAGAVYVFAKPHVGGWVTTATPTRELAESAPGFDLGLGKSLATYGRYVVAGAPNASNSDRPSPGRADVFTTPSGGWSGSGVVTQSAELTDPQSTSHGFLGTAVAVSADAVDIGVPNAAIDGNLDGGFVDIFNRPSTGWSSSNAPAARFEAVGTHSFDSFGSSVAAAGSRVVVGAPGARPFGDLAGPSQGAAYLFTKLPPPTLTQLKQSHTSWREGRHLLVVNARKTPKWGTTLTFTLNEPGTIVLAFERQRHDHYGTPATTTTVGKAGKNHVVFDGRLSTSTSLAKGSYKVLIRSYDAAGDASKIRTLHFRIIGGHS